MKVAVIHNIEKGGVEMRFSEKPPQHVLDLLHEEEWHFNKDGWKDPRWYKKHTPAVQKFAENLAAVLDDGEEPAPKPAPKPARKAQPQPTPAPRTVPVERVTIAMPVGVGKKNFW